MESDHKSNTIRIPCVFVGYSNLLGLPSRKARKELKHCRMVHEQEKQRRIPPKHTIFI